MPLKRHAAGGMGLGKIDHVVALDRGDGQRRAGLGHRHRLAEGRLVAVGVGDLRRHRGGAVGQCNGVRRGNGRVPAGAGDVDGGDIGLGHAIVGDRDVEEAAGGNPAHRAAQGHAAGGMGLGKIDDVVALDRGDGQRRAGLGHRHRLAEGRLVAVGIGDLRRHRRGAVGQCNGVRRGNGRAPAGAGDVDGGDIGLGHAIVGDRDVEEAAGGDPAHRAAQGHPAGGMGLGKIDDVVALDRGDGQRRAALGHRHRLAEGRLVAVGIGDLRRHRGGAVGQCDGVRRGNGRAPAGAGDVDGGDIGLGRAIVGDRDVEEAAGGDPAHRAGERHASRRLGKVDHVVALDRGDGQRRAGLGHRHRLAEGRLVAVGIGDLRRHRGGAVGQCNGVRRGDGRVPAGAGDVDGGDIGLGRAIVGDRDVEEAAGGDPAHRAAQGHAAGGMGLGKVDDVVALDRGDGQRRAGLGHRHRLAEGRLVAVGIGDLRRHRRGAVGQCNGVRRGDGRVPAGAGDVDGGDIGLGRAIVGDRDVEEAAGGDPAHRAGERHAGRRLGGVDHVVALDRGDGQRRPPRRRQREHHRRTVSDVAGRIGISGHDAVGAIARQGHSGRPIAAGSHRSTADLFGNAVEGVEQGHRRTRRCFSCSRADRARYRLARLAGLPAGTGDRDARRSGVEREHDRHAGAVCTGILGNDAVNAVSLELYVRGPLTSGANRCSSDLRRHTIIGVQQRHRGPGIRDAGRPADRHGWQVGRAAHIDDCDRREQRHRRGEQG